MVDSDVSKLLELIRSQSGCSFISDLHNARYAYAVYEAVRKIPEGDYSLDTWNALICYLCGTTAHTRSAEEARRYLLDYLTTQRA